MARGQRKTIDEKIALKEEVVQSLECKLEAERQELEELYEEKKRKEMSAVYDLINDAGLAPDEVVTLVQQYLDTRKAAV